MPLTDPTPSPDPSHLDAVDGGILFLDRATDQSQFLIDRFKAEVEFAGRLALAHPDHAAEWQKLIEQALSAAGATLENGGSAKDAIDAGESILMPLRDAAKKYTIYCIGHAHIDMNWMWPWQETVAATNDSFSTVDRLMDEFPAFKFSQSQASIYHLVKTYTPWLYERVKQRVKEGRWEITANHWVEGDKNMFSGESICRQILYAKRFFREEFGLPYDSIVIDWEPDTFGHPQTVPTIVSAAGIKRYYFCRTGPGPHIFWWQGKDGSRVLAFDDRRKWYNNRLDTGITRHLFEWEAETGLKDYMLVYGIGDHGGGPTRQDLRMGEKMNTWPIFPNVRFATTADFFDAIEAHAADFPVVDAELNTIFEGCYTSQSAIKHANRRSENAVVEAESAAILGRALARIPYPADSLRTAWQHTMFNQFHDILPGSGVHATYEHAQGLFQEILAHTSMAKTRALRSIAAMVRTTGIAPPAAMRPRDAGDRAGHGLGGGAGDIPSDGSITRYGSGGSACDPVVIFNPSPWTRSDVVTARIWNRAYQNDEIVVTDDSGRTVPAQFLDRQPFWWLEHEYQEIAFPVSEVGGMGYRTYVVSRSGTQPRAVPAGVPTCSGQLGGIGKQGVEVQCFSYAGIVSGLLENDLLRVVVEQASGAIVSLFDKRTGVEMVPAGQRLGLLEHVLQAPTGMSAWHLGQIVRQAPFVEGGQLQCTRSGPYLSTIRSTHSWNDSTFTLDISLAAGSDKVQFDLDVNWLERGSSEIGMPGLRVVFPLAVQEGKATFECPNGHVSRPCDGAEVPAQKWVDLVGQAENGARAGAVLVNDNKYGFSVLENTIRVTLLRSSYDPDPLPEMGPHRIRFAIQPHDRRWTPSSSTRAGYELNQPLNLVSTTEQDGSLPSAADFVEILTPSVMLSCMKKAEDSDALILRLYEMEGEDVTARIRLSDQIAPEGSPAFETDLLEQPTSASTAFLEAGVLSVRIPAFGMKTVCVGGEG